MHLFFLWFAIIGWIVCGVLSFGLSFAYFQRAYPMFAEAVYRTDWIESFVCGLFGPIGLLATFFFIKLVSLNGYQGFKWK